MPTVVVLLLVLFEVLDRAESNELIVETFENLDFGFKPLDPSANCSTHCLRGDFRTAVRSLNCVCKI
ncbi:hypothetical protein L596_004027 [Steinernema carpocapsae]|uniref:Invertebrate defensins family profile domain-containing protein n=1 Tax=Steinernema carpocapsae TaxID=34508 RepID=A0A4U8UW14_STECR|nr:hypothetical protein L596_004027 [Steinernema carpocapsae]